MDLDRACLKCGKKRSEVGTCGDRWHRPNAQNTGQQRVQVMTDKMWEGDGKDEMIRMVKAWAAADPEGFKSAGFGDGTQ